MCVCVCVCVCVCKGERKGQGNWIWTCTVLFVQDDGLRKTEVKIMLCVVLLYSLSVPKHEKEWGHCRLNTDAIIIL